MRFQKGKVCCGVALLLVALSYKTEAKYRDHLAFRPLQVFVDSAEVAQDTTKKDRNGTFLLLPIITFAPETSLRLGVLGGYYFRPRGASPKTQLSTLRFPISYTLENQARIRFSYSIFMRENRHIFDGHVEWFLFPLFFYGIGPDAQEEDEELFTSEALSVNFNYFRNIKGFAFLGFRYIYYNSNITEVKPEGLLSQEGLVPGNTGGASSGVGLMLRIDSRDNRINSAKGVFMETAVTTYQGEFGSDFEYTKYELDVRKYFGIMDGKRVIAIQGRFEHNWEEPPFENLALLGGDEIMRGHYLGRFRDKSFWSAQAEYRFPLFREKWIDNRSRIPFAQRWGMVAFAGLGAVTPDLTNIDLTKTKTSYGIGFRYLAIPKERLNIRVDFGFGTQKPGFYLNIREAF